jgi:hypothetical protein
MCSICDKLFELFNDTEAAWSSSGICVNLRPAPVPILTYLELGTFPPVEALAVDPEYEEEEEEPILS